MKKSRTSQLASQLQAVHSIDSVCALLKIPDTWDVLIICDGSATKWEEASGWAWTLIQRHPTFRRVMGSGSGSHGSNIFAELMAFMHPLTWLVNQKIKGALNVYVLTDCQQMKNWGTGNKGLRSTYEEIWFLITAYARRGLKIDYRWIPRDTIDLNKLAHDMANAARRWQVGKPNPPTTAPVQCRKILRKLGVKDIHRLNPLE